ncbi:MAG: hypothetical protein KGY38_07995, partial [Desulfobacterales bacterium]|nr:hypothetical protein [Desulfobacterales bacterium]
MTQVLINFDFPEKYSDALAEKYPELKFVRCPDRNEAFSYLQDTEILITFFQCTKEIIDAAPGLKWIQAITAGVDYMPLDAIFERGIIVTNGRGIHRINMAEYAMAAMISLARNFHLILWNQARRKWDTSPRQGEIYGATVGIVGLGEIGGAIAEKASVFGMRVIGVKRSPEPVDFVDEIYGPDEMAKVFEKSDYVINLLPFTTETHKVIDAKFFNSP